ncbi:MULTISPECIES: LCP family protein [unclassified Arthrobacter]|uniref:LCP family protein n=1 Tax=unclassified Arthrobacter TaxID=235627 RepID=UPI002E043483|nr:MULTISPECIES: LCP family protein [unclassified Arthrobacter]MEC5189948.1 LCP family protein required for cell wall assembly [Arthrobacter sp. MP_M4]MEC5201416.1 LCP family protein required for cell wall assembly [Arthrobacter sp. MP_M7]
MGTTPEPADAAGPAAASGGRHRRRTIAISVIAGLVVLALAVAAFLLNRPRTESAAPVQTSAPAAESSPAPTPTPDPPPGALNILLIGSDSRVNERAIAASGAASDQRGDALVFIHLPADRQHVYGISVMRDLWVDIPGYGAAKVNAGLELGGVPLMTQTVESLLGQHIDHTVMLDFQGFAALTDALGGVDVDIKQAFQGTVDDFVTFPQGVNRLNGVQALAFVRERHAFADGDYQRVRNQQAFIQAVMAKMAAEGSLSDRNTVKQLLATVLPHVTVDPGLTLETLERLAFSLRSTPAGNAVFFTLPTAGTGTSNDGQSIVLQDRAATAAVAAALTAGTLPEYIAANNLQNGN